VHETLVAAARNFGQLTADASTTARVEGTPLPLPGTREMVKERGPAPGSIVASTPLSADPRLQQLVASPRLTTEQKAQHLFQSVMHRGPRRREIEVIETLLEKAGERPEMAWQAVWSALQSATSAR
jgi:hypothetical protein